MRVFVVVLVLGLVAVGIAVVGLGEFPPAPHQRTVEHVLPNSSLHPHS